MVESTPQTDLDQVIIAKDKQEQTKSIAQKLSLLQESTALYLKEEYKVR